MAFVEQLNHYRDHFGPLARSLVPSSPTLPQRHKGQNENAGSGASLLAEPPQASPPQRPSPDEPSQNKLHQAEARAAKAEDEARTLQHRLEAAEAEQRAALEAAHAKHAQQMQAHAADTAVSRVMGWPWGLGLGCALRLTCVFPSRAIAPSQLAAHAGGERIAAGAGKYRCAEAWKRK